MYGIQSKEADLEVSNEVYVEGAGPVSLNERREGLRDEALHAERVLLVDLVGPLRLEQVLRKQRHVAHALHTPHTDMYYDVHRIRCIHYSQLKR